MRLVSDRLLMIEPTRERPRRLGASSAVAAAILWAALPALARAEAAVASAAPVGLWTLAALAIGLVGGAAAAIWIVSRRITAILGEFEPPGHAMEQGMQSGSPALHDPSKRELALERSIRSRLGRGLLERQALQETSEDLTSALRRAGDQSILKGKLLDKMSREMQRSLGTIAGMSELLIAGEMGSREREYARAVQQHTEQLIGALADIADFSKAEAGRMCLLDLNFDLRNLVIDVAAALRGEAEEKGLELNAYIPEDIPSLVRGDAGRLRQVLVRLIENAIQYTDRGEVTLVVDLVTEAQEKAMLKFTVEDTGVGIAPSTLDKLFEKHDSGGLVLGGEDEPLGLGLALSRRLLEAMGSKLEVKSEPGKGSTFCFRLNLAKQRNSDATAHTNAPERPAAAFVVSANAGRREQLVLLLGDRLAAEAAFADFGEALNALRAQAASDRVQYAIGLIDDLGAEDEIKNFVEEMRSEPKLAGIPLIYIAAAGHRGAAAEARKLGFAGYVGGELTRGLIAAAVDQAVQEGLDPMSDGEGDFITRHSLAERRKRNLRILVVEDDPICRGLTLTFLKNAGYRAEGAENGRDALEKFAERPYGLVLMDCDLPVMDGFEATAAIRELEANGTKRVPIVALTALNESDDRQSCLAAGMDDFIAKPVVACDLLSVVGLWALEVPEPHGAPRESAERESPDRTGDDPGLIRTRFGEAARLMKSTRRAVSARRTMAAERAASLLKTQCEQLGLAAVLTLLAELERHARAEDFASAEEVLSQAETEFSHAREDLKGRLPIPSG